jgi:hypothetical protein
LFPYRKFYRIQGASGGNFNFFEVIEYGHCEKSTYEQFSDSELLLRERGGGGGGELLESPDLNPLDSCFWGWMKINI